MERFLAGMLFGLFVAMFTIMISIGKVDRLKHQAIERGYALYCPTTGDFAWKGECDGR